MRAGRRLAFLLTLALAAVTVAIVMRGGGDDARRTWSRTEILDALREVETGGVADPPDGDGGLAIGPYQIHEVYWRDAIAFDPALGGDYQDCREAGYAERVIDAYMRRWAPAAWASGEAETIARTHNGGPQGPAREATRGYWLRVRRRLP
ncbi:MAG: hypothetical protein IPM29_30385 [Planctomycetes bacterium]|nr:hypothetical protein [Planctomycetota bacterium]